MEVKTQPQGPDQMVQPQKTVIHNPDFLIYKDQPRAMAIICCIALLLFTLLVQTTH